MPSILWSSEEIKKRINLYLFMDKNKGIPSLMDKLMQSPVKQRASPERTARLSGTNGV